MTNERMPEPTHPIIVMGSSAGGWEALPLILENLPDDLPASIFVVQHLSSETMGEAFIRQLNKKSVLPCAFAVDKEPIQTGRVYVAPPDYHLFLTKEDIRITKGPRENGFRPSVDTLFRSAAANFSSQVIGVILSGMRDDGVEGLNSIGRSGGITVVQDPANAPYPDLPQAVIGHMQVNHIVKALEMGLVLSGLVYQPAKQEVVPVPTDVLQEATIAQRVLTGIEVVEEVGTPTGFTCPTCGGVLWDVNHDNQVHSFRCNAGHAFSPDSLMAFKSTEIEETMWAALRLLEEQKRMLQKFPAQNGYAVLEKTPNLEKRIAENQRYIDRLRSMLLGRESGNGTANW